MPKAAAKSALTTAVKPARSIRKRKMVRDSLTIPKAEYAVLDNLKQRAARPSQGVKESELLRAGIKELAAMPEPAFLSALQRVAAIKTQRTAAGN